MWLMYPLHADDIRSARRGVVALLAASTVWYVSLAAVLAVWTDPVLFKVRNKFMAVPAEEKNWLPFLILLAAFTAAGGLRALGYRLGRNVTGAVAVPEATNVAMLGVVLWLGACGTVYIGFTGLLALITALGTAVELRFLRYPVALFGLVVSPRAARRVGYYFTARAVWLGVVIAAALVMLVSHAVNDIPRNPGGPYEATIQRVTGGLHVAFQGLAGFAVLTLPVVTAMYWGILFGVHSAVGKLLDPDGPVAQEEPPPRPGFDQLKQVLQPQVW